MFEKMQEFLNEIKSRVPDCKAVDWYPEAPNSPLFGITVLVQGESISVDGLNLLIPVDTIIALYKAKHKVHNVVAEFVRSEMDLNREFTRRREDLREAFEEARREAQQEFDALKEK